MHRHIYAYFVFSYVLCQLIHIIAPIRSIIIECASKFNHMIVKLYYIRVIFFISLLELGSNKFQTLTNEISELHVTNSWRNALVINVESLMVIYIAGKFCCFFTIMTCVCLSNFRLTLMFKIHIVVEIK